MNDFKERRCNGNEARISGARGPYKGMTAGDNPFDRVTDPERHELWIQGFVKAKEELETLKRETEKAFKKDGASMSRRGPGPQKRVGSE